MFYLKNKKTFFLFLVVYLFTYMFCMKTYADNNFIDLIIKIKPDEIKRLMILAEKKQTNCIDTIGINNNYTEIFKLHNEIKNLKDKIRHLREKNQLLNKNIGDMELIIEKLMIDKKNKLNK